MLQSARDDDLLSMLGKQLEIGLARCTVRPHGEEMATLEVVGDALSADQVFTASEVDEKLYLRALIAAFWRLMECGQTTSSSMYRSARRWYSWAKL